MTVFVYVQYVNTHGFIVSLLCMYYTPAYVLKLGLLERLILLVTGLASTLAPYLARSATMIRCWYKVANNSENQFVS
jgi:hypothetical protein